MRKQIILKIYYKILKKKMFFLIICLLKKIANIFEAKIHRIFVLEKIFFQKIVNYKHCEFLNCKKILLKQNDVLFPS